MLPNLIYYLSYFSNSLNCRADRFRQRQEVNLSILLEGFTSQSSKFLDRYPAQYIILPYSSISSSNPIFLKLIRAGPHKPIPFFFPQYCCNEEMIFFYSFTYLDLEKPDIPSAILAQAVSSRTKHKKVQKPNLLFLLQQQPLIIL